MRCLTPFPALVPQHDLWCIIAYWFSQTSRVVERSLYQVAWAYISAKNYSKTLLYLGFNNAKPLIRLAGSSSFLMLARCCKTLFQEICHAIATHTLYCGDVLQRCQLCCSCHQGCKGLDSHPLWCAMCFHYLLICGNQKGEDRFSSLRSLERCD
jgi:hypothetical protein